MFMLTRLKMAVAVAVVAFPFSLPAQFQAPTDEELKMTAEPKAPGASAIYLYREQSADDNFNFQKFYVRIKVLTEKGKELATVSMPYLRKDFSITDIKGRTIHPDGTVFPLEVKPDDLMVNKSEGFQVNKKVFTLPNVEVGSILEYSLELRYDEKYAIPPFWDVQQAYFVRKEHFTFVKTKYIGGYTLYTPFLPAGVKVVEDQMGRFTLNVTDEPPVADEEYSPPTQSLPHRVEFYYSHYFDRGDFWKYEGDRWSKDVDRFAEVTKGISEAAHGIVGAGDSDDVKARKIYDAVMKLDNTDFTRRKSASELKELGLKRARQAEDIWNQKSGASDEIALLYLALARAAGLKAYAMAVCSRERNIFNPNIFSFQQFRDEDNPVQENVVILFLLDKDVFLDPGQKYTTFGQLEWKHTLAGGIRQIDKGTELAATPGNSYKEASVLRSANLTVAADGGVAGTARITLNGPAALHWRQMAITDGPDEVKQRFNESMAGLVPEGAHAELDHFLGLEEYNNILMAVVKISGVIGTSTGKRMFLPYAFFESHAKHPFVAEAKRLTAVDMHYADVVREEVTYTLPDGYAVESLPADTSNSWPSHAIFQAKVSSDKSTVTINRNLARAFILLEPGLYNDLRDFYQKVATADQQQLVLARSAANQ